MDVDSTDSPSEINDHKNIPCADNSSAFEKTKVPTTSAASTSQINFLKKPLPSSNFSPSIQSNVARKKMPPTNTGTAPQIVPSEPVIETDSNNTSRSIKIQNMVGTLDVECELNLKSINCRLRYAEYNPKTFAGLIMKILNPRTTVLAFESGKIVVLGAKTEADCKLSARKFIRILQKLNFPVKYEGFTIRNMVCTCHVPFPIRLENLSQIHSQFCTYEPQLFPGLIYRMVRPQVVVLIFVNGRIVITGGRSKDELQLAFDNMYPVLQSFRKQ